MNKEIPTIEPYRELWEREEQDNKELREEIERLNNIINELEKTLKKLIKEELNNYEKYPENWKERECVSNTWLTSRDCYWSILTYLEKLKGENNE